MKKIGLTGSIGSGKSTVTNCIKEHGYLVLDADEISRSLTAPGSVITDELVKAFSDDILDEKDNLDRKKLARIAFSSNEKTEILSNMVTMRVKAIIEEEIVKLSDEGIEIVFLDVPLLFEYGMNEDCDEVWAVVASDEIRYERVKKRDGLSKEEFLLRDKRQISQKEKIEKSDRVYCNDGTKEELEKLIIAELDRITG